MPKISEEKKKKVQEHILHYLFSVSPQALYTSDIAKEIARDEEFTKFLLLSLKDKNLVTEVKKNASGKDYIKRQRWIISSQAFAAYSKHQ
ncbi:hypothetical protein J4408_00015 [Candidatus Pacearchaeota archaeon]|nr:hypothetical protein [Candidatus Pacearchaeota archaeon]